MKGRSFGNNIKRAGRAEAMARECKGAEGAGPVDWAWSWWMGAAASIPGIGGACRLLLLWYTSLRKLCAVQERSNPVVKLARNVCRKHKRRVTQIDLLPGGFLSLPMQRRSCIILKKAISAPPCQNSLLNYGSLLQVEDFKSTFFFYFWGLEVFIKDEKGFFKKRFIKES